MRHIWPFLLLGTLAACGGGGGGGSGSSGQSFPGAVTIAPRSGSFFPTLAEPASGSPASAWRTAEFEQSTGLALIQAAAGYAARTTGLPAGEGVRVGIMDSGVDFSNAEFAPGETYKFTNSFYSLETQDVSGHGTHVAGIVGARRDGYGVHGVAYNATLVDMKVLLSAPFEDSDATETGDSDIALAILSAAGIDDQVPLVNSFGQVEGFAQTTPGAQVDVVNMSFGGTGGSPQIRDAMQRAGAEGTIMVVALGNEGRVGPSGAPASYVDQVSGNGIAVAALDASGTQLSTLANSNSCGALFNCLAAPGEEIQSTLPTFVNDMGQTHYGRLSGTSMAAPHVAGAAAAAKAAFPGVASADIVARILATADDIGAPGRDRVFGHGRLNMAALLSPVGALSVPTGARVSDGAAAPQAFAAMSGPGGGAAALARYAGQVMAVDAMGFPFQTDLSGSGVTATRDTSEDLTAYTDVGAWAEGLAAQAVPVALSLYDHGFRPARFAADEAPERLPANLSVALAPDLRLGLSTDSRLHTDLGGTHSRLLSQGVLGATFTDADPVPFSGEGDGMRLAYQTAPRTWVEVAFHRGDGPWDSGPGNGADVETFAVTGRTTFGPAEVALRGLHIAEDGTILGGAYDGFAQDVGARTLAAGVDIAWQALDGVTFTAGYTLAQTDPTSAGLARFGQQISDSASAAAAFDGVLAEGDRVTLMAQLPFATRVARARLDLPVARTADGTVIRERQDVDLSVGARERALQAVYYRPVGRRGAQLDLAGFHRQDADHVRGREDWGAALRLTVRF